MENISKRTLTVLSNTKYIVSFSNEKDNSQLIDRKVINEMLIKMTSKKRISIKNEYKRLIILLEKEFKSNYGYGLDYSWE